MKKSGNGAIGTGVIAAIAASSCCLPPIIAAVAGVGGLGSAFSWIEPLRPYLIALAVISLGYAWYTHLKKSAPEDCCDTEGKPSFFQSRNFLILITLFSVLAIGYPYISSVFYSQETATNEHSASGQNITVAELTIIGMSCGSCENHVNTTLINSEGVFESTTSYESGKSNIKFDNTVISIEDLAKAIEEETGYVVTESQIHEN
ncbi:MAG TPA: mercuric transport protein MerTP [Flavobacteriales bacterium]|jgi:copper chaperone CopZ|nr:mercuric transport protein MerTP [Flavobacteriales bacterium]HIO15842.1 mercuric transport protein MerTP [Flavobacteriales bacterium]